MKLITTYVEKADDLEMIHQTLVPQLLEAVLLDYKRNVPDAREAEVLAVITVLITKLQVRWTPITSKYLMVRHCINSTDLTIANLHGQGMIGANFRPDPSVVHF